MRLLVVEDEHSLREDIARKLRLSGYEVDACADGEAALEALTAERYDLVLLDLNLPKVDGMQVLRSLRRHDLETCVLILSARSEISDKVEGLDAGANDYLSKPFHLAELEARVRSLTRRKFIQQDVCLCCGRLSFNTRSRVATVDSQTLALTRKESGVLEYLLLHQGRPVSQEELIEHVWDGSVDSFSNSIRVHISALRKKLRAALGYDPIRNRIGEVSLVTPDGKPYVTMDFDAPLFAIWSPEGKDAPFVCIEPWYGRCDADDFEGTLEERAYENAVEPKQTFEASYSIRYL